MTDVRRIVAEHRRAVWLIAAGLILNAALLIVIVLPLSRKVSGGEEEAQRASTELSAARRDYDSARATVTGKAQADVELKRFYQDVLPSSFSGARRVLFPSIEQLAKKSNLRYHDANIQADGEPIGDLQKVSMTFNLAGEYTNIRRFIHELETEPEFRVIESVALAQAEEGERGLNVTAHVATYYRTGGNGN
jgi:Tfp pilus assembly protein PilO